MYLEKLTRRLMMKYSIGMGLGIPFLSQDLLGSSENKKNIIINENKKQGTTEWQLTYVRSENYRSKLIEGYCSKMSLFAGESLDIFLSGKNLESNTSSINVEINIYRMGYYGGKGGRYMTTLGPFVVTEQATPPIAEKRLRFCEWDKTTTFTIPDNWISGVYLGKLTCDNHRYQSYIIFIVRDNREADLLFQTSDTTWQAYNKWPDQYSLYDSDVPFQPHSSRTWVSYDRPFGKYPQILDQPLSQGSGEFLLWEFPLCFWLEKQGYDVTYWSNIDTHDDRKGLDRVKCFLSVGHDEYWSISMFNHLKDAVDKGLSVAFLSSNTAMWVIDIQNSAKKISHEIENYTQLNKGTGFRIPVIIDSNGQRNRIMYRVGRFGGVSKIEQKTGIMGPFEKNDWVNENTLIGARTMYPFNGSADWIVTNPDHWILEGTGMQNGDSIPGLVGWEHHGDPADIPGLQVIAEGVTINSGGKESYYTSTVYPGKKGNWVFNAATIYWSHGLANPPGVILPYSHFGRPHGEDQRVQTITGNFFRKCGII